MKKSIDKVAHLCERERENTPTNLFKKSIFHRHWLRGKLMSNLYVKPWYPVGAILEFDRPMDMTATYGGTWELFGAGRMTVGIDTRDADFNTAGKMGGSKEMQSHSHSATADAAGDHRHPFTYCSGGAGSYFGIPLTSGATSTTNDPYIQLGGKHEHTVTVSETGNGNAGNMSPYIVVYRYRKVDY